MTEGTRILLVEADEAAASAAIHQLESLGYDVAQAASGADAAALLRSQEPPFDLILIDAELAARIALGDDGHDLFEQQAVPILFLASEPDSATAEILQELSPFGFAPGNAGASVLGACIRASLARSTEKRELSRLRKHLEHIGSHARLATWEYDGRSARFLGSEAFFEALGLPPGPTDLATVARLYPPDASATLERALALALSQHRPFSLVSEITLPSGQRKWVRTQGRAEELQGSGADRLLGTLQDISEIRLLDRVADESELTLNQVEALTHVGHWSVNVVDGSFFHSDEIKRIFGYEPSEYALSVEDAIKAYHPDDREEVTRLFTRAVETGEGYEFDLRVIRPSGEIRYVHSTGHSEKDRSGRVTRVYGTFQDVTEHELAERALRESEASMKALIDGVPAAIVVHDSAGNILLSNRKADQLLSPLATGIVGKGVDDVAWQFVDEHGDKVAVEDFPVSRILRTRQPLTNLILGWGSRDAMAWMLVDGTPVFDADGAVSRVIVSFVDISERKEMEEQLRRSEKMRAIGQLAGGVAHDFNNQLAGMLGFAELLKMELREDSDEHSYVDAIIRAIDHSADLTKQLLAFARKGKYVVTSIDMDDVIATVVSMVSHTFDKKIRVLHHRATSPATISGDGSQLENALLNIALNSRDAMVDGGELAFATERVTLGKHSPDGAVDDLPPGEYVRITARDTGVGMDAETQRRIFEPFFTTKEPGRGTGMGMASVYGTVQSHNGAIEVVSAPGEGTTVTMHLPVDREAKQEPEERAAAPAAATSRIMIVDDEELVARSMGLVLASKGYETTTWNRAGEALAEYRASWRSIDLVVLDMVMPDISGAEAFRELRKVNPDARILLISGYSISAEAKNLIREGAVGFLLKPVPGTDLCGAVSEALAR